jgi:hypothetical protein
MTSVFGLVVHLDPSITLGMFISLVFALLIFERALENIEHRAAEARFAGLVKKLYKEMLVTGFVGFAVFILFNIFPLKQDDYFMAFEFAHITISFVVIILVFRALFVVISSNRATAGFWRAHNQQCRTLLDRYVNVRDCFWSFESLQFHLFPFWSGLFADIEYKIIEDFFHTDFNLSRYEFSFVDYLTMSNKLYAVEKVELSYISWFMMIVLAIFNYIRTILVKHGDYNCSDDDHLTDDGHHDRPSPEEDDGAEYVITKRCADYYSWHFVIVGTALMLFGLFICFITWRSKVKLLEIAGNDTNDYEDVLTDVMTREQETFEALAQKHLEMDERKKRIGKGGNIPNNLLTAASMRHLKLEEGSWHVVSLRKVLAEQKKLNEDKQKKQYEKIKQKFFDMLEILHIDGCWKTPTWWCFESNKHGMEKMVVLTKKRRSYGVRSRSMEEEPEGRTRRLSCSSGAAPSTDPVAHRKSMSAMMIKGGSIYTMKDDDNIHPLMYELDSIFILENRQLYIKLLEVFQMFCSLYLALYLTNFVFISMKTHHVGLYTTFSLGSIAILLLFMSFTQFHSNVLFSVTSLQNGSTDWICEQDDIKNKTLPKLREELINIIDKENFAEEISDIFNLVNENADDGIDMKEFRNLLFTLNIQLNNEEIQCLFRVLNVSGK